ncbi:MAG: hypothetical protein K6B74_01200 [Ruminococcus sp.]|nr:hypothetical protein [Ruminococcus sp.]
MDFLIEILDDLLELLLPLIKKLFLFIKDKLIPFIVLSLSEAKHNARLKKFKDELDIKAHDVGSGEKYFTKE